MVLIERDNRLMHVAEQDWRAPLGGVGEYFRRRLAFLTEEHRRMRNYVVAQIPRNRFQAVLPEQIASAVNLGVPRVNAILEDLERHLFFVWRNSAGAVTWAFPVTTDRTPHRIVPQSGDPFFAACAVDAFAAPFVLARLWRAQMTVKVESECAHCGEPVRFTLDGDLEFSDSTPLVFSPQVDFDHLRAPNIIDDF